MSDLVEQARQFFVDWLSDFDDDDALVAVWAEQLRCGVFAALGLTEEQQSVPVAKDGSRWAPRPHAQALRELQRASASDFGDGWILTHIERESRLVSPWVRVGEETKP